MTGFTGSRQELKVLHGDVGAATGAFRGGFENYDDLVELLLMGAVGDGEAQEFFDRGATQGRFTSAA